MLNQLELDGVVRRALLLYNRFHSPEAFAKVVSVAPDSVTVSFSGIFCYNCGVLDFLEDFIYDFKILTDKAELKVGATRQVSSRTFEADYRVKQK